MSVHLTDLPAMQVSLLWPGVSVPNAWDSRSLFNGTGNRGSTRCSTCSGSHGWFGQFGAISSTVSYSSLILCSTGGMILTVLRQRLDNSSPSRGVLISEKNNGQCAFYSKTNNSSSVSPNRLKITWTIWGCSLHSPWTVPPLDSKSGPQFRRLGTWTACIDRRFLSAHKRKRSACLWRGWDWIPPWWLIYTKKNTVLSAQTRASRIEGRKDTAFSSRQFMCHFDFALVQVPQTGLPSQNAHASSCQQYILINIYLFFLAQGD